MDVDRILSVFFFMQIKKFIRYTQFYIKIILYSFLYNL